MLSAALTLAKKLPEVFTNKAEQHQRLQDEEELKEIALRHVPQVSVEFTDMPVYDVLARLNVVRQRGRVNGDLVEHDFLKGKWHHKKTKAALDETALQRAGRTPVDVMTDKHDIQPMTVIRVVGFIDFSTFVTSVEHRRALEKKRIFDELRNIPGITERLKHTFATPTSWQDTSDLQRANTEHHINATTGFEELLDGSDDDEAVTTEELPPPVTDTEEYKAWVKGIQKHQSARFIKQYLQRAIPAAARTMSSLIVYTNTVVSTPTTLTVSDIALALNKGMFSERCEADDDKAKLQNGQACGDTFLNVPMLLGVHVCEKDVCAYLCPLKNHKKKKSQKTPDGIESTTMFAGRAIEQLKEKLSQFSAHLVLTEERNGTVAPARRPHVVEYVGSLVRELGRGNDRSVTPEYPFRMKCMGTVYILIGGDAKVSVLEIQQAVEEGRPVLVIEGSGGYADVICGMIHRVEEVVSAPSVDDYRSCLGAISPRTSSVISSGCITIVPKGTSSEMLEKMVEKALSYDETLHSAWKKYALWDYNSQYCRAVYLYLQMLVLALGIMTITLSIFQTFLQLQYPIETGVKTQGASTKSTNSLIGHIYTWLGLIVVILPVGLSLVEAIENKLNAGGRWVALRSATESMLREIYMYRTQVRNYSPDSVKRGAKEEVPTEKKSEKEREKEEEEEEEKDGSRLEKKIQDHMGTTDSLSFRSKQEKLSQWIEHLIGELKESECANASLLEYSGPLPPPHILDAGDDGWKDLTPDEYVAYRLHPLISRYERAAKYYEISVSRFTLSNYFLGALGTLLAALSSVPPVDTYNLQSWVSLTTGVSNAVTRYMDYARMDFLQKKSNKVKMDLTGVQSWWDSRGDEAGSFVIRNELVTKVEALVTGEFIEWGGQMKKAMDKAKKESNKDGNALRGLNKMHGVEEIEKLAQLKDMGLADISADTLASALENPDGPEATKLKDSMSRLQTHIEKHTGINTEDVLKHKLIQEQMLKIESLKEVSEQFLDDTGALLNINLGGIVMSDFVPADIAQRINNPKERRKMFRATTKLNPAVISRSDCLNFFTNFGEATQAKISEMSQRQMLETVKSAIVSQLHEELIQGLKNFNICIYDLIPRDDMVEELLLELRDVGKVGWRDMETEEILMLIKNAEIRSAMAQLNEVALRGLLKRADKLYKSRTAIVFQSAVEKVAKLDVEELFDSTTLKAEMFDTLDDLSKKDKDIVFMPKVQLLQHLPAGIRNLPHVKNKPQAQLVEYVQTVKNGFSATRKFSGISENISSTLGDTTAGILRNVLKNKRLCDRFFFAVSQISQRDINRLDKKTLMRQLAMSPAFSPDMVEELKYLSEKALKCLMSGLKSAVAGTYQARVFDLLCDSVTTFDLRNLLPCAEDREKFVNQVREFKGVDLVSATKEEMITTLAFKSLVVKFLKLSRVQIAELVERSLILMGNAFHSGIFVSSVAVHLGDGLLEELSKWDDETADKLCLSLMRHPSDILTILDHSAIRVHAGTASEEDESFVASELLSLFPDQTLQVLFNTWDIDTQLRSICEMRAMLDERVLASIFEGASNDLPHSLAAKFQGIFIKPRVRNFMLECLFGVIRFDFVEVTQMNAEQLLAVMVGDSQLKHDFFGTVKKILLANSDEITAMCDLRVIVLHLLNEILLNVPYNLFLKLCMQNCIFDLRELLDEPQTRRLVAVLLLKAHHAEYFALSKEVKSREILDGCDRLIEYEAVVNDMRVLSEEQLVWLTGEVLSFFSSRDLGHFFSKYLETNQEGTQPQDTVDFSILMEAVVSVKCYLMLNPVQIRNDFRFFDAEQFFTLLTEEEKVKVLQKYIADDSIVRRIACFNHMQFSRLFAHILAFPSSKAEEGQGVANRQSIDMRSFYEGCFKNQEMRVLQDSLSDLLDREGAGRTSSYVVCE